MSASHERELLFAVKEKPELQDTPGYTLGLFTGHRRKLAEAISDLSNDRPGEPIDEGVLSIKAGLPLIEMFKEFDGCYRLSPEAFQIRVNLLVVERKYSERAQLVEKETRAHLSTGGWDKDIQDRISAIGREIEELEMGPVVQTPEHFLRKGSELQAMSTKLDYDVEELLPSQAVTVLYGRGGVGKTWISLQLAKAVSEGDQFLGRLTKQRPVVYVDFENPLPVLIERTRILDICEVLFWHQGWDPKPPKLDGPGFEAYKRLPAGSLIIFDTLRAAHNGDENASDTMGLIMGRVKSWKW